MPSNSVFWKFCLVLQIFLASYFTASLASECLQRNSAGEEYTGVVNETVTGQPCVHWSALSSCEQILPDKNLTLAENFCRNPDPDACHQDKRFSPWCYTSSSNLQWEYCDVPRCDVPSDSCSMALGMGSGAIADSQITASSVNSEANAPYKARINNSNSDYWIPSYTDYGKHYLKVDLLRPHTIMKLYVQGSLYSYVQTFNVLYSLDGLVWTAYSDTSGGEMKEFIVSGGTSTTPIHFDIPFTAVKIVIVPRTWYSTPGLRLEIFGCPVNVTMPRATEVTEDLQPINSQWSLQSSPFVVRQKITLRAGATLTIQAGVKVVFIGQDAGLNVLGCLQLNGIKGIEVQMVSGNPLSLVFATDSAGNAYWQGVTISPVSAACSLREISNLVLSGATVGLTLTANVFHLLNVVIKNSRTGVLSTKASNPTNASFVSCLFDGNQYAIDLQLSGNVLVKSTVFTNNDRGLLFKLDYEPTSGSNHSLDIRGSQFLQNTYSLISGTINDRHSLQMRLSDSSFIASEILFAQPYYYCGSDIRTEIDRCSFNGSKISTSFCSRYTASITNSLLFNSRVSALSVSGNCRSLLVLNSSIYSNNGNGLELDAYPSGVFRLERNLFSRNTGAACVTILIQNRLDIPSGNLTITGNSYLNNSVTNTIYMNDLSPDRLNVTVLENKFENQMSNFELYIDTPWQSNYFLDAKKNWWGGSDEIFIESRIKDFFSDFRRAIVDITSVYLDSAMTNLIDSSTWRDWNANGYNFGGIIRENLTINMESMNISTINVTNSILVSQNTQLQLIGSKTLSFSQLTGIVVEGILILNGLPQKHLILQSEYTNGFWGGLSFVNSVGSHIANSQLVNVEAGLSLLNSSLSIANSNLTIKQGILCTGNIPMMLSITNTSISSSNSPTIQLDVNSNNVTLVVNRSRISAAYSTCINIKVFSSATMQFEDSLISAGRYDYAIYLNPSTQATNYTLNILRSSMQGSVYTTFQYATMTATDSSFDSASSSLVVYTSNSGNLQLTLQNNTFRQDRDSTNLFIYSLYGLNDSVTVRKNRFIAGQTDMRFRGPKVLDVSDNIFSDSSSLALVIRLGKSDAAISPTEENNAVRIANNIFRHNTGSGVVSFDCNWNSEYVATVQVMENTFHNNSVTNVVSHNCRGLLLTGNIFQNFGSSFDYRSEVDFNKESILYATGNFWNTSSYGEIAARVYDRQDQSSLSAVEVSPWFKDINLTSLGKLESTFFRGDGFEIGGPLTENITLQNKGQSYTVVEEIFIPAGKTLSIQEGVQLVFKQGGITVEGRLLALGTENNWISMGSEISTSSWTGITFNQRFNEEVIHHDSDWWEVRFNYEWKALEFQSSNLENQKLVADILCKEAGFQGAKEFGPYDCSVTTTSTTAYDFPTSPSSQENYFDASSSTTTESPSRRKRSIPESSTADQLERQAPCNDPGKRAQVFCNGNEMHIGQCSFQPYGQVSNPLLKLSCLRETLQNTRTTYSIVSQSGAKVKALLNDTIGTISEGPTDILSELFVLVSPCLSGNSVPNCVSVMTLRKPGWFLRHFGLDQLLLEPKTNPRNSTTFARDASFLIRDDRFITNYVALESINLPEYFASLRSDGSGLLTLQQIRNESSFFEAASVRLVSPSSIEKRRKRDTSGLILYEMSQLKFVRISSATNGITVEGKAPELDHVVVANCSGDGILQKGYSFGNFTIANSEISFNKGSGITLKVSDKTYASYVHLIGCNITGNERQGVAMAGRTNLTITNCIVRNNGATGIDVYGNYYSSISASVESSEISSQKAVALSCSTINACILRNNSIVGNLYQTVMNLQSDAAVIEGNRFENNYNDYYSYLAYVISGSSLKFVDNIVRNNQAGFTLYISGVGNVNISRNYFTDNSKSQYASLESTIFVSSVRNLSITENFFDNPLQTYEIRIDSSRDYESQPFDLSRNFWNRQNYSSIIQRIDCFYNNMDKKPVNIWPAVLDPENNSLLRMPNDYSYFFEDGTGGEVQSTLTIPSRNESYTVERSIYVEIGAKLIIAEGVVLMFKPERGIFVKGTLVLQGTPESPVKFTQTSAAGWNGFVLMQSPFSNATSGIVELSHVIVEGNQKSLSVTAPVIKIHSFTLNANTGLSLQGGDITVVNSTFIARGDGLKLSRSYWFSAIATNATISNSTISSSETGLSVENQDFLSVTDCMFLNNSLGINIYSSTGIARYVIRLSHFLKNVRAVSGTVQTRGSFEFTNNVVAENSYRASWSRFSGFQVYSYTITTYELRNNLFSNLSNGAVSIEHSTNVESGSIITITDNTFSNISETALILKNILYYKSTIQNNSFTLNSFPDGASAVDIFIWYYSYIYGTPGNVSLSQNKFLRNTGQHIVKFTTATFSSDLMFPYSSVSSNLFLNNIASESVILTQYNRLNINRNVFKNPLTGLDLKVGFSNSFQENCTFNWWGSTSQQDVGSRIFDTNDDSSLGLVLYEPFLNASEFSCEALSGCSGHGLCVLPETCECTDGWQGSACSQPSCSAILDCYGRGQCIGPNICQCQMGWFGSDCSKASCNEQRNCSDHGICVNPNQCLCSELYAGADCSNCSAGRWGTECLPCPRCVHGRCDQTTGNCICNGANWAGDFCDSCAPKYFGAACLPLLRITRIVPVSGPDTGNTSVHIYGANYPNVSTYRCRFDSTVVPGVWISDEDIMCLAPQHSAAQVLVALSVSPEQGFLTTQFSYSYLPQCPAGACGSQLFPPRGGCAMGNCICFVPWIGKDCSILGLPPKIIQVSSQAILEAQPLELVVNISQGTTPVEWQLLDSPSGMLLGSTSGRLQWTKSVARIIPYLVTVRCSNTYGSDQMTFNLIVPPSYSAVLDPLPRGPFSKPQSVLISGKLVWTENNSFLIGQQLPVNIVIKSLTSTRTISLNTGSASNLFYTRFYPTQYDIGLFQLDARHPSDPGFSVQQSWSVYGLQIETSLSNLDGYTGQQSYASLLNITNVGVDALTDVQLLKVNVPFEMRVWKSDSVMSPCLLSSTSCSLTMVLQPGESISLNASVTVSSAYNGYFMAIASTREGTTSETRLRFSFQEKLPAFRLSVDAIESTVSRGRIYYYEVNVTNVGLRPATNVKVLLPNEPILSILSFGTNTSSSGNLILDSGDTAVLVLQISPSIQESINARSGSIQIKSLETSILLNYRFVISSLDRLNLTVTVEDEYTYFSADRPNLANASVSLTSKFGGDTITLTTNASGQVTFQDIREDYYTLYTSAARHRPDSRVIFASAGNGSLITVFIQRVAVTYSWVVTPVTYEDRYDIKLEADFKTNVPIPVVTLTPNRLDLEVLEHGLMPVINFAIRNYGLIAAKAFRFQLPSTDAHPFLQFHMDRELVGDIPANTTIVVSVSVMVNETKRDNYFSQLSTSVRKRRATPASCLALILKALYYYICDRERYADLIVSADYASSYANCGGGGIGGVGGGGGSWTGPGGSGTGPGPSSSNTDISVTSPLTCNKVVNCGKVILPCIKGAVKSVQCIVGVIALPETVLLGPVAVVWAFGKTVASCVSAFKNVPKCYKQIIICIDTKRRKRSLSEDDLYLLIERQYIYLTEFYHLGEIIYDDPRWFESDGVGDWWSQEIEPAMFETSSGGQFITVSEYNQILSSPLPGNVTIEMAQVFLNRLNSSLNMWNQGNYSSTNDTIDYSALIEANRTIAEGEDKAKQAGFDSVAAWFLNTYERLQQPEDSPDEGVCAKVRIQILQRLVLTRNAFSARLEIENGETSALTNIRVEIIITDFSNLELANNRFSIGRPDLNAISDINGTGMLPVNTKCSAQWLIAPYSTAAPTTDKRYKFGGTLYYMVNGENITVPLFPDTVTVKPDPRLYISYFLEKFVSGDDPLTTDIAEPVVPFSLGVLITNNGYGVANNLKISSAQPEIIDNEKGLLIKFVIIATQLGNSSISPSLTVEFGDILPKTTKMARWIMTSTLSGIFSNYSATFQNTNPLGDPQLSVLDSLKIYELLHVVRVDYPSDDGLVDFLTINPNSLDLFPNNIYQSDDGTRPLNVSIGNVTSATFIGSNRLQVTTISSSVGWVYFRLEYQPNQLALNEIRRSDGRLIKPGTNIWISKIKKKTYLHLIDYMQSNGSHFTYDIQQAKSNADAPRFTKEVYNVSITEDTDPGIVAQVSVVRQNANDTITYSIRDEANLPFTIGATDGIVQTKSFLDREKQASYSVIVLAKDDGIPPLTGTAVVYVEVDDVNDNSPVLGYIPSDIYVEKGVSAGYVLCVVTASDSDAGLNGEVQLSLNDESGMFSLDSLNGSLVTKPSVLQQTGNYSLTIIAKDEGTPSKRTEFSLTVHVLNKDLYPPKFLPTQYVFSINETKDVGQFVGQVTATDDDNQNELLTYSILPAPGTSTSCVLPFQVDSSLGNISNFLELRSETCNNYTFSVLATDSGAPPTGPLIGRANVTVLVLDINDNAPEFAKSNYSIHVRENLANDTVLLSLRATDKDSGANGAVVNYTLSQTYPETSYVTKFSLDIVNGEALLKATQSLDREECDRYLLQVLATDNGLPPLTSKPTTVEILVDDINDNPPMFGNNSATVTLLRRTPVNAIIYRISATDKDAKDSTVLRYVQDSDDQYIQVQPTSGVVLLIRSLVGTNITSIPITVHASDGLFNSSTFFTLNVLISDKNVAPPRFDSHEYRISVNESVSQGIVLLRLAASDPDTPILYYYITRGNEERKFKVDTVTGNLQLVGFLDRESTAFYNLTVEVFDSQDKGNDTLSDAATVFIVVLEVNEHPPVFVNLSPVQVHLTEGRAVSNFLQLKATDADGDNVTYSFINSSSVHRMFLIDSDSGWLSQLVPLDRKASQYMLQVIATDSGIPTRQSVVDVVIFVDEAFPTFETAYISITTTPSDLTRNATIYAAKAVKVGIEGNQSILYFLDANSTLWFAIDNKTGVIIVLVKNQPIGEFVVRVFAADESNPPKIGNMTLVVTISGDWTSLTSAFSQTPPTVQRTTSSVNDAVQNFVDILALFISIIFVWICVR